MIHGFSEKIYLELPLPTEDSPESDAARLLAALEMRGYDRVTLPLPILRKLYPLCREGGFTVSLALCESGFTATALEAGDTTAAHYGIAVDCGSTTVVMQLVDMNTGEVLAQEREMNGQIAYGTDILSRITYALSAPAHREDLRQAILSTFHRLFVTLTAQTGIRADACPAMIISGNTTMIHMLLGLDAWTVFSAPYAPVTLVPGFIPARELGLDAQGMVYIIPAASNYVGGDIVSGMLKLQLHRREEVSLFFDIGTNGELVIGNREWLAAGAGAAGPALEGYISRYGMCAKDGAIDSVSIHGSALTFTTIGNKPPVGICGSGIIDLLAQMRLHHWIDIAGTFDPAASDRIVYLEEEQQYAVVYAAAADHPLFFTQTDIRQYLDTKAAAYTMIQCLLETVGCTEDALKHCYLSGAFSAHSDLDAAITLGMFPDLPRETYCCISNTSLEGARILLTDRTRLQELAEIREKMYCVQFASFSDFLVRMQAAKFIPHTDLERFPTIAEKL